MNDVFVVVYARQDEDSIQVFVLAALGPSLVPTLSGKDVELMAELTLEQFMEPGG